MREIPGGEHKEAPLYLAVMSADPRVPDTPIQPPVAEAGPREDRKSSSPSTGSNNVNFYVDPEAEEGQNLHHPSSSALLAGNENTKSAFVITSVSAYQEDLEMSMHHPKGMSHEADSFVENSIPRGQSESSESDETAKALPAVAVKDSEIISESTERQLPGEAAPNGPVVASAPRQFRRLNNYVRGRWTVEDTSETKESEQRGTPGNQGQGRESPYVPRKGFGVEGGMAVGDELAHMHSRTSSDLGVQDIISDRDSHVDRSSVVGETASNLSRNTSMSSLTTAGDKSMDGDHSVDRLNQLDETRRPDDESEPESTYPATLTQAGVSTTAGPSAAQQTMVSSPSVLLRQPEATSSGSSIVAATTSDSGGEDTPLSQPGAQTRDRSDGELRVKSALSQLTEELKQMLDENKEIVRLKQEKRKLEDSIKDQGDEMEKTKEENKKLEDSNRELKAQNNLFTDEITRLKEELKQKNDDDTRLRKASKSQPESTADS